VANNPFEAERIKEALEEEGIPVLLRTFEDTAYDGIYVAQKGWGYVEVPKNDKPVAEQVIQDLKTIFKEESSDQDLVMICGVCGKDVDEGDTVCPHCGEELDDGENGDSV